jgi:iron(III) transport system substrate-binding protein
MKKLALILGSLVVLLVVWQFVFSKPPQSVVLYCAHDAVFADAVIRRFTAETGIHVAMVLDSEATKSLGLVERLRSEKTAPQADVFWNNEQLGTMALADEGVLAEHKGPGWARIPERFRDPQGRWTGFAARLRVEADHGLQGELLRDPAKGSVAKPMYGTTLTHYCALWARFGGDAVKAWHAALRAKGLREVDGNGLVAKLVGEGSVAWGLTDTDDAFGLLDAGKPVRMRPARVWLVGGDGAENPAAPTIVIPNTVAVVAGSRRPEVARQLADFLLAAATEEQLANGPARQIPLGPVDEAKIPAAVRDLRPAAAQGIPLDEIYPARAPVLAWLRAEYGL